MKITVFQSKNAKIIQIFAWVLAGLNTLLVSGFLYVMGIFLPQIWLLAIPWIGIFVIALFSALIGGISLTLGGIAGVVWYIVARIEGIYAILSFTVAIISGLMLVAAWYLENKSNK